MLKYGLVMERRQLVQGTIKEGKYKHGWWQGGCSPLDEETPLEKNCMSVGGFLKESCVLMHRMINALKCEWHPIN